MAAKHSGPQRLGKVPASALGPSAVRSLLSSRLRHMQHIKGKTGNLFEGSPGSNIAMQGLTSSPLTKGHERCLCSSGLWPILSGETKADGISDPSLPQAASVPEGKTFTETPGAAAATQAAHKDEREDIRHRGGDREGRWGAESLGARPHVL